MISRSLLLLVVTALLATTHGQDYQDHYEQDYSQDGLYADYARQQQAKEVAGKA